MLTKILTGVRIRYRLAGVLWNRKRQLRGLLRGGAPGDSPCPVCGASRTTKVYFERPEGRIEKLFCGGCGHLFTDFLQTDPDVGREMFHFETENASQPAQAQLLEELAQRAGLEHGVFLDFGVGGNISAFQQVGERHPEHRFMGCDTYPSEVEGYFQTYSPTAPAGIFDGISSYAVVEHLTGTIESWLHFNRLLKPMAAGGGIMVHSFPSQLHHDFEHWAIQIRSHVCLFSRKSLAMVCAKAGFVLEKGLLPRPTGPHDHPVMVFRKVRDV
jgi:hypothetical protein